MVRVRAEWSVADHGSASVGGEEMARQDSERGARLPPATEVEATLLRGGHVTALGLDEPEEVSAWAAWDLASVVEGCFHVVLDPDTETARRRETWLARLGASYVEPGFAADGWLTRYFWLAHGGERVGTLALPVDAGGAPELVLWSLYVRPEHRSRGVASRLLDAVYEAAVAAGLSGVRVDTHWAWQDALRFYIARRMWVTSWQDAIGLVRSASLPEWAWEERGDTATFSLVRDGRPEPFLVASRQGERVMLREVGEASGEVRFHARATMALQLALRGWPLVGPEQDELLRGLHHSILRLEARHRADGWDVRTLPRERAGARSSDFGTPGDGSG